MGRCTTWPSKCWKRRRVTKRSKSLRKSFKSCRQCSRRTWCISLAHSSSPNCAWSWSCTWWLRGVMWRVWRLCVCVDVPRGRCGMCWMTSRSPLAGIKCWNGRCSCAKALQPWYDAHFCYSIEIYSSFLFIFFALVQLACQWSSNCSSWFENIEFVDDRGVGD